MDKLLLLAALGLLSPLVAQANDVTPKFGHYEGLATNADNVRPRKIYFDFRNEGSPLKRLELHIQGTEFRVPGVAFLHDVFHFKKTAPNQRSEYVGMGKWKTNQKVVGDFTERGGAFTPDRNIHYKWTAHWVRDLTPSPTPPPIVHR